MLCANPRTVASGLQYVWITDDLLVQAFNRFLRVSNTDRRYGSNVPGPLEARRRLAKRRMGMESVSHHNIPPPAFDVGSWLGLRTARPPPDFEGGLRWQPPSVCTQDRRMEEPQDVPLSSTWHKEEAVKSFFHPPAEDIESEGDSHLQDVPLDVPLDRRKDEPAAESITSVQYKNDITSDTPVFFQPLTLFQPLIIDDTTETDNLPAMEASVTSLGEQASVDEVATLTNSVETSKSKFETLLKTHELHGFSTTAELLELENFISSPTTHPHAELTLRLVQWLGNIPAVRENFPMWQGVTKTIQTLLFAKDGNIEEITSILMHVGKLPDVRDFVIPHIQIPKTSQNIYVRLLQRAVDECSGKDEARTILYAWMKFVKPIITPDGRFTQPWPEFYALLAQHFHPSDFPEHFGFMTRHTLAWVLLRYWVPRYAAQANRSGIQSSTQSHSSPTSASADTSRYEPLIEYDWKAVHQEFTAKYFDPARSGSGKYVLTDLLSVLVRRGCIPCERLIAEIFAIHTATKDDQVTKALMVDALQEVGQHEFLVRMATRLINHHIAQKEPRHTFIALAIFRAATSVQVEECPNLTFQLVGHKVNSVWDVVDILDRHPGTHFSEKRVALIHETAYAWACDPNINARQAFRNVWRCYRLLLSRRAPLYPQISRAMVRTGITRSLQENHRLSQAQVKFIISIVRAVEGDERAEQLDKLVFDHWTRMKNEHGYSRGLANDPQQRNSFSSSRKQFTSPAKVNEVIVRPLQGPVLRRVMKSRRALIRRLASRGDGGDVCDSALESGAPPTAPSEGDEEPAATNPSLRRTTTRGSELFEGQSGSTTASGTAESQSSGYQPF